MGLTTSLASESASSKSPSRRRQREPLNIGFSVAYLQIRDARDARSRAPGRLARKAAACSESPWTHERSLRDLVAPSGDSFNAHPNGSCRSCLDLRERRGVAAQRIPEVAWQRNQRPKHPKPKPVNRRDMRRQKEALSSFQSWCESACTPVSAFQHVVFSWHLSAPPFFLLFVFSPLGFGHGLPCWKRRLPSACSDTFSHRDIERDTHTHTHIHT